AFLPIIFDIVNGAQRATCRTFTINEWSVNNLALAVALARALLLALNLNDFARWGNSNHY
ncbi:hypothetical protein, partial [Bartonella sp. CL34QHWL]|uniref:hypothetical protein n=1 Tax=Bartonella sp. CL34QHWL TaxID=3243526 RepID=UPI0035CF9FC6